MTKNPSILDEYSKDSDKTGQMPKKIWIFSEQFRFCLFVMSWHIHDCFDVFRHLWVGLAVLLCILSAGLLVFFMFPRSVMLESTKPYLDPTGTVAVNVTEQYVNFEVIVSTCTCSTI